MKNHQIVTAAALVAVTLTGCSKTQTARAGAREDSAKPVKTEAVRQESLRRAIEVVGTLAAEDQVTISSQAEGAVSRVLADLGDRVKAGQVLVELDREKLAIQPRSAEGGAGAGARQLRRDRAGPAAADRADARRAEGRRRAGRRPSRPTSAPTSCTSGS